MIELLKNLDRKKFVPSIILNRPEGFFFDQIPADVKIIDRSEVYKSSFRWFERYFGISSIIRKERIDLVVSFLPGANRSLMRSRYFTDPNIKFILNEQNNPNHLPQKDISGWKVKLAEMEAHFLYPKANSVIVSCNGLRNHFINEWQLPEKLLTTVYNPINLREIRSRSKISLKLPINTGKDYVLIGVGRLTEQKGYYKMLKVIKEVRNHLPVKLFILGEGPEKTSIQKEIKDLELEHCVYLAGFVSNPWAWMKRADLYLSTSIYEGFHLTIAEAMACGTPPIVMDCDYGPREIIEEDTNGFLIPPGDVGAMAGAVTDLLKDKQKRKKIAFNARKRAEDFDIEKIVSQYEYVFDKVLSRKEEV